ncbi:peptidase S8, partial [Stenotrophomonas panacihumi]
MPLPSFCSPGLLLTGLLAVSPAWAGQVHVEALVDGVHDRFIVTYREGDAQARMRGDDPLRAAAKALPVRRGRALQLSRLRRLASGQDVVQASRALDRVEAETLMRQLAADPAVLRVEVDQRLQTEAVPSDPLLSLQWALAPGSAGINVQPAWDMSDGAGVVVAIIDTGVYPHPDLAANLLPGYDFLSDATSAADGDGRDADPTDVGDWAPAGLCRPHSRSTFSSWHGTQVAGIAGASHNGEGVAGVGVRARLLPLRVSGKCGAYISDILDAIDWASGGSVSGVPANASPAEVINMSMGTTGLCSPSFQAAIDRAVSRGTVFVTSAGNGARDARHEYPANCQNTITVAASKYDGGKASFSNHGPSVDLTAPGQEILTTHVNGPNEPIEPNQRAVFGTSMAAPHVAGVVALMQAVARHPLTPARIEAILKATARPMPVACPEGCGAGLLDAGAAVAAARAEPAPP